MTDTQQTMGESMFHEIKTAEQGQKYILEIVGQVDLAREQCNQLTLMSKDPKTPVPAEVMAKAWKNLTVRYGQALGSLVTLMHCRILDDEAYNKLRQRIDMAMIPKTFGTVS